MCSLLFAFILVTHLQASHTLRPKYIIADKYIMAKKCHTCVNGPKCVLEGLQHHFTCPTQGFFQAIATAFSLVFSA